MKVGVKPEQSSPKMYGADATLQQAPEAALVQVLTVRPPWVDHLALPSHYEYVTRSCNVSAP